MGDCERDCKRIAESSTTSLAKKPRTTSTDSDSVDLESHLSNFELGIDDCLLKKLPGRVDDGDRSSSSCSCYSQESHCSASVDKIGEDDGLRFVDQEARSLETENSTCINNNRRETSPSTSSKVCTEAETMESTSPAPAPVTSMKKRSEEEEAKKPSQAEIEEFFSVAEEVNRKRFAEKYNYDIVKDMPLEGRYQWVRLKP